MKSGIYRIWNTRNGKFYVGSTRDFSKREKAHFVALRAGKHHCDYLQRAYDKEEDKSVFVFESPLLTCSEDTKTLEMYEQQFLNFYGNEGRLYNNSMLAGRVEMTPEIRAKLGTAQKGKKHTLETRTKISNANKGSNNGRTKLTKADVLYIRASNETSITLSEKFKVNNSTISDIRTRRCWKHVA